jgi:hypothetical protein
MALGHVSLPAGPSNWAAMRAFYIAALAPLGYSVYFEGDKSFVGMKTRTGGPDFWLHYSGENLPAVAADGKDGERRTRTHVAFDVGSRRAVDAWYRNAV